MLTTADRTSTDQISITHEFLSSLLGCSRSSVTVILGDLETKGAIHNRRGRVEVADRRSLEASSCECYGVLKENFANLKRRAEMVGAGR
jgi:hypothetical protein